MKNQKRNANLDILRTIAVLLVMASHINDCPENVNFFLNKLSNFFIQGGWVGVDLFFVLSGFLVSGLIFREHISTKDFDAKNFLIRRGFKIYPSFYFFLFITLLVNYFYWDNIYASAIGGLKNWVNVIAELTFFQNYLGGLWSHTWSLAVEEHFYILLAILFYFVIRKKLFNKNGSADFSFIPKLFIGIAIFCFLARVITAFILPEHPTRLHILATHTRMDSLMFGVFLSYLFHYSNKSFVETTKKYRWLLVSIGSLFVMTSFLSRLEASMMMAVFGLTIIYIGAGLLLSGFLAFDLGNSKIVNFFGFLGSHSYSVYLWHQPVNVWGYFLLRRILGTDPSWYLYATFYIIFSWIIGIIFAKLIEIPFLKIRDKMFRSKSDNGLANLTK